MPDMELLIICIVSFAAAGLTLFSGFGLGTILMPVFAIFFPIELAVTLTAIVHLLNNLFKLILTGKYCDKTVLIKFGLPAVVSAAAGAFLLNILSGTDPLFTYTLSGKTYMVYPVKAAIGFIILLFAVFEGLPKLRGFAFDKKYLISGGIISGFFGGLSGHQGALRSAFISRIGLSKEAFVGTGVVIACLVDVTRMTVYSAYFVSAGISENILTIAAASICGFAGVFTAAKLLKKFTVSTVQNIISFMLFVIGALLMAGII